MQELKPFLQKTFAASASYDQEFSGRAVTGIGLKFAATNGSTDAAGVVDDAPFVLLGTPEVNQHENPLIRMRGKSWRHLAAILNGGYPTIDAGVDTAEAHAFIPLSRMVPGAIINAQDAKVFFRGTFGALADYADTTTPGEFVGTLRPFVEAEDVLPTGGFLRPKISETTVSIESSQADQQHVIRFDQDTVLAGIMVITEDASATATHNVDGLVKEIRVDVTKRDGGTREILRERWGMLRQFTVQRSGWSAADHVSSAGCILLPFFDKQNTSLNNAMLFNAGDSITLHLDSAATVEEEFSTVAPASGDTATLTLLAFTPVSGTGDTAAQVARIEGPSGSGARSRAVAGRVSRRLDRQTRRGGGRRNRR